MAINSSLLAVGSSIPAKANPQSHLSGPAASLAGNSQSAPNGAGSTARGTTTTSSDSASAQHAASTAKGSGQTRSGSADSSSASKSAAATQPRNSQTTQSRGKSRARNAPMDPTANQVGTPSQAATDAIEADFGSAMATALGRSATNAPALTTKSDTARSDTAPRASTDGQSDVQATAPAADAAAWIAQVLMPGQTNQAVGVASSDTDASDGAADAAIGGMAAAATPPVPPSPSAGPAVPLTATPAADAQAAVQNGALAQLGAPALPSTAPGSRPRPTTNTSSDSTTPSTLDTTPAPTAPAASAQSDIGALADVQHLISGLTAGSASDDSDTDTDAAAAPATTHAATPAGSADAAQAAAALQASSASRPGSGLGPTTLTIHAPVSSPAFTNEVTAQVSSLAQAGITQAQLHLNPTDMGPVQVHITLQAGQASVWFGANHADTRAALEQSLPRLREMFAGAGMPLTDSGVFREPPRHTPGQPASATTNSRDTGAAVAPAATVTQVSNIRLSLLDTYA